MTSAPPPPIFKITPSRTPWAANRQFQKFTFRGAKYDQRHAQKLLIIIFCAKKYLMCAFCISNIKNSFGLCKAVEILSNLLEQKARKINKSLNAKYSFELDFVLALQNIELFWLTMDLSISSSSCFYFFMWKSESFTDIYILEKC